MAPTASPLHPQVASTSSFGLDRPAVPKAALQTAKQSLNGAMVKVPSQNGNVHSRKFHPMDPLTKEELLRARDIVQRHVAEETNIRAFKFASAYIVNPSKPAVLSALGLPALPESCKKPSDEEDVPLSNRRTEVQIIDVVAGAAYEIYLDLYPFPGQVVKTVKLKEGLQPSLHPDEVGEADEACRNDPRVVAFARSVGVEPHQLYADGWSIGWDDRFDHGRRVQQCLMYARKSEHENLYAHPMDFSVVLDANTNEVLSIDVARHRGPTMDHPDSNIDGRPPPVTADPEEALRASGRERILPPMQSYDYLPELMASDERMSKIRSDLKPLYVVQPEGVSYSLNGNEISWQKWNFHIGFHPRDGLVISTVTYNDNGEVRPLFYRMSLAEMVVPYAETAFPQPRKFAFDVGEYGMGTQANSLKLGCDCLGTISYLDGHYIGLDGQPITIDQCICIHEEDAGLAFKHTDYRKGGKVHSARNRKLVIQMICTIANYEYLFNYNFYTDGSVQVELRLTGILNLYIKKEGEQECNPYGVEVAPQVTAQLHQHIFSLRVDPMIDGHQNTLMQSDVVPTAAPFGSAANYLGNGFRLQHTPLTKAGAADWDPSRHRTFSIANPTRKHYSSGLPVAYRIHTRDYETLATSRDSIVSRRARFATKDIWVTKHDEEQLWPAGKYVPQQRDTAEDCITHWVEKGDDTEATDVVVWVTFGITHVPRPEDFPIMPVEHLSVWLKPANFFNWNPASDLPKFQDTVSRKVSGRADGGSGSEDAVVNALTKGMDTTAIVNGTNGNGNSNGNANGSCCSSRS